jgi:hypothetical protein
MMLSLKVSTELQYKEVTWLEQGPVVWSLDYVNVSKFHSWLAELLLASQ